MRHEVTALDGVETGTLIDLYTLLSDVQRTNDLRKKIADTLLDRLHHDRPVSGSYGSVQRTARTNRSLKDDEEVLDTLESAGIDRDKAAPNAITISTNLITGWQFVSHICLRQGKNLLIC